MTANDNDTDLRTRVVSLEHNITGTLARLTALEQWQRKAEITDARSDEKWKNVDKRFDDLDGKIEKVSGILSKIMWLVISGLIMAFVAFMIGGGLKAL